MSPTIHTVRQLGATIRSRRNEAKLTATETAALAHVSRRLLIELERGKRPNVGFQALGRVLQVLGLDLEVTPRGLPGSQPRVGKR
jgi:transcriptional regulator with XRE-family HTH domain